MSMKMKRRRSCAERASSCEESVVQLVGLNEWTTEVKDWNEAASGSGKAAKERRWCGEEGGVAGFYSCPRKPLLGDDGEAEWIESERQANFSREMAPESWRAVSFARGWPLIIVQSAPLLRIRADSPVDPTGSWAVPTVSVPSIAGWRFHPPSFVLGHLHFHRARRCFCQTHIVMCVRNMPVANDSGLEESPPFSVSFFRCTTTRRLPS